VGAMPRFPGAAKRARSLTISENLLCLGRLAQSALACLELSPEPGKVVTLSLRLNC
jgi:hypothetical protein